LIAYAGKAQRSGQHRYPVFLRLVERTRETTRSVRLDKLESYFRSNELRRPALLIARGVP